MLTVCSRVVYKRPNEIGREEEKILKYHQRRRSSSYENGQHSLKGDSDADLHKWNSNSSWGDAGAAERQTNDGKHNSNQLNFSIGAQACDDMTMSLSVASPNERNCRRRQRRRRRNYSTLTHLAFLRSKCQRCESTSAHTEWHMGGLVSFAQGFSPESPALKFNEKWCCGDVAEVNRCGFERLPWTNVWVFANGENWFARNCQLNRCVTRSLSNVPLCDCIL